jgi:uncharacterized glyoxalase superfamily protein PhnB
MIAYEDGPKAMDWLSSAFGFKERGLRARAEVVGRPIHRRRRAGLRRGRRCHFAQAKQRGAAILTDVETDAYGKRYRARTLERPPLDVHAAGLTVN